MVDKPLRATQAVKRLGITTKELLVLMHERRIGYVMHKGIAHVPPDALDKYQSSGPNLRFPAQL